MAVRFGELANVGFTSRSFQYPPVKQMWQCESVFSALSWQQPTMLYSIVDIQVSYNWVCSSLRNSNCAFPSIVSLFTCFQYVMKLHSS